MVRGCPLTSHPPIEHPGQRVSGRGMDGRQKNVAGDREQHEDRQPTVRGAPETVRAEGPQRERPLADGEAHDPGAHSSAPSARARIDARTRAAVIGSSSNRTPIASLIALRTAAATGMTPDSPRPLAPNGPSASTDSISRTTISGMSPALKTAESMNVW